MWDPALPSQIAQSALRFATPQERKAFIANACQGDAALQQQALAVLAAFESTAFQNPALAKSFSLLVVDGERGIGNGRVFPAGPLRASLDAQLKRANAMLVVGAISSATHILPLPEPLGKCPTVLSRQKSWAQAFRPS